MTNEIRVCVKFMSALADIAGSRQVAMTLSADATLADLANDLGVRFGEKLAERLGNNSSDPYSYHTVAVVDGQFYGDPSVSQIHLRDGMTVVFMEPVAGGSGFGVE